jgi:molybdate transport system ATP-binding protein
VTRDLRSFTLHVELDVDGVLAVVGPSGAGKSTLLRLIAGLDAPSRGRIECDGDLWFGDGRDLPPERRRCGFVFQDYALFPHMTVRQNVAYGADGTDIDPLLERVGIGHLAAVRPPRLSGGERQRVALARALALQPQALLLDEPLSALDPATRGAVAAELAAVLRDAAVPAIVVTHAYDEAVSLAGRVAVIEQGRVVQEGTPRELLEAPLTSFVAEFAGTNYLPGMASGGQVHLDRGGSVRLAGDASAPVDDSAQNHIAGAIERVVPMGNRVRVTIDGIAAEITPESAERLALQPGVRVIASWKATSTRILATG